MALWKAHKETHVCRITWAHMLVEHTPRTHQINTHVGSCLQKLAKTRKHKTPTI
jgi:hypothetical protein